MSRINGKRKRKDINNMAFDSSSELGDEIGVSGLSFRPSDSDSDSSTEDLDVITVETTKNNPVKKFKAASKENVVLGIEDHSEKVGNQNNIGYSSESSSSHKDRQFSEGSCQGVLKIIVGSEIGLKNNRRWKQTKLSFTKSVEKDRREEQEGASASDSNDAESTKMEIRMKKSDVSNEKQKNSKTIPQKSHKEMKGKLSMKGKRVDPKMVKQGLKLLREGFSNKYVAYKLNLPTSTVANWSCRLITKKEKKAIKRKSEAECHGLQQSEDTIHHSEEVIAKGCELLKQEISVLDVMLELGVCRETVMEWKEKYIPKKQLTPKLTDEQMMKACELFEQGHTAESVAEQLSVSLWIVKQWRKFVPESKIFFLTAQKSGTSKILDVCERLSRSESLEAVSESTGVPCHTVNEWKLRYLAERQDPVEGPWNVFIMLKACQQLQRGVDAEIVAKELNVSVNLVRKWENENVVPLRAKPNDGNVYDQQLILEVGRRLQLGQSGNRIAIELSLAPMTVHRWKERYFTKKNTEVKDGRKYKKETILKACELLRQGESVMSVSRKIQVHQDAVRDWRIKYIDKRASDSDSPGQIQSKRKCDENMIQEGCKLLKQGHASKEVAGIFKVSITTVDKWKRCYIEKRYSEPQLDKQFDKKFIGKVCKRLQKGEKVMDLSRELGIQWSTIQRWNDKYVLGKKIRNLLKSERARSKNLDDAKLKSECCVALKRDPMIDVLSLKKRN